MDYRVFWLNLAVFGVFSSIFYFSFEKTLENALKHNKKSTTYVIRWLTSQLISISTDRLAIYGRKRAKNPLFLRFLSFQWKIVSKGFGEVFEGWMNCWNMWKMCFLVILICFCFFFGSLWGKGPVEWGKPKKFETEN